jgi:hypothetical protein
MSHSGADFYDDDAVFATYVRHRQRANNPNDTLEKPVVLEMIGSVEGQRVLDLGWGMRCLVASCWLRARNAMWAWKAHVT